MNWKSICTTAHDRIDADRRLDRIWALGNIAYWPSRARAIQIKMQRAERKAA